MKILACNGFLASQLLLLYLSLWCQMKTVFLISWLLCYKVVLIFFFYESSLAIDPRKLSHCYRCKVIFFNGLESYLRTKVIGVGSCYFLL